MVVCCKHARRAAEALEPFRERGYAFGFVLAAPRRVEERGLESVLLQNVRERLAPAFAPRRPLKPSDVGIPRKLKRQKLPRGMARRVGGVVHEACLVWLRRPL